MTPQEKKELLLRVVTKLAARQLANGGFIPFGATLGSKRDVQLLMPKSMKTNVARDELRGYWARELAQAASEDRGTVCWCADVRIALEGDAPVPAVLIHIEHPEAYAEDVLYPYEYMGSECLLQPPIVEVTDYQIFAPRPQIKKPPRSEGG